jgi:hypothetical protein
MKYSFKKTQSKIKWEIAAQKQVMKIQTLNYL